MQTSATRHRRANLSRHLINVGAAIGIVGLLTTVGTALDRWDDLALQQRALDDAVAHAQADQRRNLAALKICGPNAAPQWDSATELRCLSNGHKVRRHVVAQVTP